MKTRLTNQAILEQARATCELTGATDRDSAWNFTYSTWESAAEDPTIIVGALESLEDAFNQKSDAFWSGE